MKPTISPTLLRGFAKYSKWYVGRHFHSVRLSVSGGVPEVIGPTVIYLNHASWWDPLIGLVLARALWPGRRHYAPIDAEQLKRYGILSRLGFFGVEAGTARGAAMFLRNAAGILENEHAVLWVTSEGRFRDPRARPVELRAGVAHLARRVKGAVLVPLAIEYPFWEERFPEVLCRFGKPIETTAVEKMTTGGWMNLLADGMRENQDRLASEAIGREEEAFRFILRGRAGVGGIYDAWRWAKAKLRREKFHRGHGDR